MLLSNLNKSIATQSPRSTLWTISLGFLAVIQNLQMDCLMIFFKNKSKLRHINSYQFHSNLLFSHNSKEIRMVRAAFKLMVHFKELQRISIA